MATPVPIPNTAVKHPGPMVVRNSARVGYRRELFNAPEGNLGGVLVSPPALCTATAKRFIISHSTTRTPSSAFRRTPQTMSLTFPVRTRPAPRSFRPRMSARRLADLSALRPRLSIRHPRAASGAAPAARRCAPRRTRDTARGQGIAPIAAGPGRHSGYGQGAGRRAGSR